MDLVRSGASVCIAAYNEEATIGATLASVLSQEWEVELEVLVCANACTDGTAACVQEVAFCDHRVRLIEIAERGKQVAWNRLVQESRHELLFFVDADVLLAPDSFARMAEHLERNPEQVAVTGRIVPATSPKNALEWLFWPPDTLAPGGINGRLYAVRKRAMLAAMVRSGYAEMPRALLAEDRWLTLVVGDGKWGWCKGAVAAYIPADFRDALRNYRRAWRAKQQIAKLHPKLEYRGESTLGKIRRHYRQIRTEGSAREAMRCLVRTAVIQLLVAPHFPLSKRELAAWGGVWSPAWSTKRPFNEVGADRAVERSVGATVSVE